MRRSRIALATLTIAAFSGLFIYAVIQLLISERQARTQMGETHLWAATEAQSELQKLLILTTGPMDPLEFRADAQAASLRFELLFSRVALLNDGPQLGYFDGIGQGDTVRATLALMQDLDHRLYGPAFSLAAARAAGARFGDLSDMLREVVVATMLSERTRRAERLDRVRRTTFVLSVAVLGMFATGALMASQLVRNIRSLDDEQQRLVRHQARLEDTIALRTAEIRDALAVERRAKEVYRSFVMMVSHQFRTPLSVIHMTSQRLTRADPARPPTDLGGKAFKILNAAKRLERLISRVVVSASLDAEGQFCMPEPVDLNDVVRNALRQLRETHPNRVFACSLSADPLPVEVDVILVEQVTVNLMSNAAKYSPDDSRIDIRAMRAGDTAQVRVTDRGMGIPEAVRASIFDKYYRAPNVQHLPGLGLGLHLATEILDLHDGRLDFTSTEGEGSVFTMILPLRGSAGDD